MHGELLCEKYACLLVSVKTISIHLLFGSTTYQPSLKTLFIFPRYIVLSDNTLFYFQFYPSLSACPCHLLEGDMAGEINLCSVEEIEINRFSGADEEMKLTDVPHPDAA